MSRRSARRSPTCPPSNGRCATRRLDDSARRRSRSSRRASSTRHSASRPRGRSLRRDEDGTNSRAATRDLRRVMSVVLRERPPRQFVFADELLAVRVRESRRAKTTRLIVGPRRPLEVIVPRGVPDAEIDRLLESKHHWIEMKVAAAREIASRPPRLGLERPGEVWLAGEQLSLERLNGRRSYTSTSPHPRYETEAGASRRRARRARGAGPPLRGRRG